MGCQKADLFELGLELFIRCEEEVFAVSEDSAILEFMRRRFSIWDSM